MIAGEIYIYFKSKRKGLITFTPVIPFPQDNLGVFNGTQKLKNVVPEAKIQVYDEKTDQAQKPLFNTWIKYAVITKINEFMASTFKLNSRLPDEYEVDKWNSYKLLPKVSVPDNARTISIKMDGYEHGEKCHDFLPIEGAAPGSHYTYQMYGDNRIQVTSYVVNGISEIAGLCIYVEHPWLSPTEYRFSSFKTISQYVKIFANSPITGETGNETNQQKTEINPEENSKLISMEWTVIYCSKLKRKVMRSMDSDEDVVHQEWCDKDRSMKIWECEECTEEGLEKEEQPPAYSSIFIA